MDGRTRVRLRRLAAVGSHPRGPGVRAAAVRAAGGPGAPLPASARARLRAIAKDAAAAHGDWRPSEVTAVPTTHTPAVPHTVTGGTRDVPVYLVTMAGHFSGGGHRPRGARAPAARYLSLVVDARSFWVMDIALSRRAPSVPPAALGEAASIAW